MFLVQAFEQCCRTISVEWANSHEDRTIEIDTSNLFLQGQTVYLDRVRFWMQELAWPPIGVIEWHGSYYLRDGLHRAFAALLLGKPTILAHVFPADDTQPQPTTNGPGEDLAELVIADDDQGGELSAYDAALQKADRDEADDAAELAAFKAKL